MKTITKILVVLVLSVLCSFGLADELYVPSQYPNIQAAINAAVTGDEVVVAPGTYTGPGNRDIDFLGKAITVRSESGPENCIIDCNGTESDPHRGFYFHKDEDTNSVLDGFTITNGCELSGGGIYCSRGNPTITNCTISDNSTEWWEGGGIYCEDSSPIISNCTIIGNTAEGNGGGIYCSWKSSPTIFNCIISSNESSSGGGGICCWDNSSSPTINNCIMTGNKAVWGGGISCEQGSSPTISDCTINFNSAVAGGGIYCQGGIEGKSSPIITNCTIIGNTARSSMLPRAGAGIECYSSSPTIINCKISDNSVDDGADGAISCSWGSLLTISNSTISKNKTSGIFCLESSLIVNNCTITGNKGREGGGIASYRFSTTTITNCIIRDNSPQQIDGTASVTYSDVQDGWPGQGNINTDPCFVQPGYWADVNDPNIIVEPNDPNAVWLEGDYHLLPFSPCIDTGDPNYIPEANETDLDGNPRISGTRIDMGAYEANYIEAEMNFTPKTINCNSKGNWVKAHFTLPEGFLPEDVDVNEPAWVEPIDIESEYIKLLGSYKGPVRLEIAFDRQAFCDAITEPGQLEITIIGSLTTGQNFFATDKITVINKPDEKSPK